MRVPTGFSRPFGRLGASQMRTPRGDHSPRGVPFAGELQYCVLRDRVLVPLGAELWRALLRLEVHIVDAEALRVAIGPFEVVEQAPEEVALHRIALSYGAMQMGDVVAQVHHAINVVDAAGGVDHVVGRAA